MKLEILVNHVGYERRGPKRFVVASDSELDPFETSFEVRDGTKRTLWEGELHPLDSGERGAFYVGEFDRVAYPGADLQVVVTSGGRSFTSFRFAVGDGLLWRLTKPVVLAYLRRARNARANYGGPGGWRPNAALDDGRYVDLNGGWFERGTHGGALLGSASLVTWALFLCRDRDPSDPQIESELTWAAEWWKKLAGLFDELGDLPDSIGFPDDDGKVRTGSGSPFAPRKLLAIMFCARFHRLTGEPEHMERGLAMWEKWRGADGLRAGYLLPGAVEMYASTRDERFGDEARRLASGLIERGLPASAELDPLLPGCLAHFAIRMKGDEVASRAAEALADYMKGPLSGWPRSLIEDGARDPVERTLRAWSAILACKASPTMDFLAYAIDQVNWALGMNPRNSCMMAGVGAGGGDAGELGGAGALADAKGESSPLAGTAAYLMAVALL